VRSCETSVVVRTDLYKDASTQGLLSYVGHAVHHACGPDLRVLPVNLDFTATGASYILCLRNDPLYVESHVKLGHSFITGVGTPVFWMDQRLAVKGDL